MLPNIILAHNSWLRKAKKKKGGEMYSGLCGRMRTQRQIVYSRPRQAPLLNCFCIAQFPPDGKLNGKSMKHKAEKHLNHNNKTQTLPKPRVGHLAALNIYCPYHDKIMVHGFNV